MKRGRKLIKDVILLWKGDLRGIGSIHDEMKKKSTYAKQDYVEAKKEG